MNTYEHSFSRVRGMLWDFSDQIADLIMDKYGNRLLNSDIDHAYGEMENMFYDHTDELSAYMTE